MNCIKLIKKKFYDILISRRVCYTTPITSPLKKEEYKLREEFNKKIYPYKIISYILIVFATMYLIFTVK